MRAFYTWDFCLTDWNKKLLSELELLVWRRLLTDSILFYGSRFCFFETGFGMIYGSLRNIMGNRPTILDKILIESVCWLTLHPKLSNVIVLGYYNRWCNWPNQGVSFVSYRTEWTVDRESEELYFLFISRQCFVCINRYHGIVTISLSDLHTGQHSTFQWYVCRSLCNLIFNLSRSRGFLSLHVHSSR